MGGAVVEGRHKLAAAVPRSQLFVAPGGDVWTDDVPVLVTVADSPVLRQVHRQDLWLIELL